MTVRARQTTPAPHHGEAPMKANGSAARKECAPMRARKPGPGNPRPLRAGSFRLVAYAARASPFQSPNRARGGESSSQLLAPTGLEAMEPARRKLRASLAHIRARGIRSRWVHEDRSSLHRGEPAGGGNVQERSYLAPFRTSRPAATSRVSRSGSIRWRQTRLRAF